MLMDPNMLGYQDEEEEELNFMPEVNHETGMVGTLTPPNEDDQHLD